MIHIENQNAGVINNVEGSMTVYGGQQGSAVTDEAARDAARELRTALSTADLDRSTGAEARTQAAEIDAAVRAPRPDKSQVAGLVHRLTALLAAAGSLATAGAAVIAPLHVLVGWLGTLGLPILHLLSA